MTCTDRTGIHRRFCDIGECINILSERKQVLPKNGKSSFPHAHQACEELGFLDYRIHLRLGTCDSECLSVGDIPI